MNIEEVAKTTAPCPPVGPRPLPAGEIERRQDEAPEESPFEPFVFAQTSERIWPRVFPGL
jgi:hypothetical protein